MATCAVPDCGKQLARGLLMCGRHWFMVPPAVRKRIWFFFNNRDFGADYDAAVREAVQAVFMREFAG